MLRHLLQGPAPPHRPRLFVGHAPSERGALWELWSRAAASLPPPGRRAGGRENPGTTAAEAAPPPRAAGSTVANEAGPRGPPKQEAVRAVPAVRGVRKGLPAPAPAAPSPPASFPAGSGFSPSPALHLHLHRPGARIRQDVPEVRLSSSRSPFYDRLPPGGYQPRLHWPEPRLHFVRVVR